MARSNKLFASSSFISLFQYLFINTLWNELNAIFEKFILRFYFLRIRFYSFYESPKKTHTMQFCKLHSKNFEWMVKSNWKCKFKQSYFRGSHSWIVYLSNYPLETFWSLKYGQWKIVFDIDASWTLKNCKKKVHIFLTTASHELQKIRSVSVEVGHGPYLVSI